ncbi:pyrroloquinoline quinone-dependent dehydrogenase [Sphingobium sp. EM0848]|uniref:pyrroloquinoline quinone-dependent dehydrogenase n=1 Tax=Sphingobium sp. EM0848 TaxID=2743473 RepID=UPI002100E603|nr:pyrroloquinoline quinone-dependent dehydrogenase [Sphingobium sp. EM0848]
MFRTNPTIDFSGPVASWDYWGNDAGGSRYSPLTQITPANVWALKPVWTYHVGMVEGTPQFSSPTLEATPIVAENRLYICSGNGRIASINPETGKEIWAVQPRSDNFSTYLINCRGVTYARDVEVEKGRLCAGKIVAGTLDGRMLAFDSVTGRSCPAFGANGVVDLKRDLGKYERGDISISSPPVVIGTNIVTNNRIADNIRTDMPAGVIRAFDIHTGRPTWSWNALPPGMSDKGDAPKGEAFVRSTPNSWAPMSVDPALNLVYVPMGNAPPDHIAAHRKGLDYYSSAVVALDATTGKVRWHFNTVRKDVWDYDVPSQPVLFDLPTANGTVPALAQATKIGHIFILDRRTGRPLSPVEERRVPASRLPGEKLSPTQPFPANPAFILRDPDLSDSDMWGFTPYDKYRCKQAFRSHDYAGPFTPPSTRGWVQFPSFMGASNWGSVSIDRKRGILIANTNQVPAIMQLIPQADIARRTAAGEKIIPTKGAAYGLSMKPFLSPFGAPCNRPPWGRLTAIDLKAGKVLWNVPLGTTRDQAPFPLWFKIGVPNMGGTMLTASGLIFIGATTDQYFRAYDVRTGKVVWRARLPAGGQATPMTYRLTKNGRQYVVIAAGGHKFMGTGLGDSLIAYALPDGS